MSKSSKACGYTGHMHIMDRVNSTKAMYESNKAKSHKIHENRSEHHPKHKEAYPEVAAEARAQEKCTCKK